MQQSAKFIPRQLLLVICFVSLWPFDEAFSTFHVTFINIINIDQNNKHVYYENVVNVYYIYGL